MLDPCMGSGHILVYAFDVLMDIYRSVGYTDRDAVQSIVQNNLYGLDIDDRAAQLAYFAVMMRACDYDRRFLRRGIQPHVCAIQESAKLSEGQLNAFGAERPLAEHVLDAFEDAKEFGSILHVDLAPAELARLRSRVEQMRQEAQNSLIGMMDNAEAIAAIEPLLAQAEILTRKYDAVITNPPYMNKFTTNMKRFVQENYADYKADLFSIFMHRNFELCKENGYSAFMTPFVWMFIKSYEKLREEIIAQKCINTLIQMEYSAFEEATVPICTFVLRNSKLNYKGNYLRLSDFKGGMDVQNEKVLEAQNDPTCKYRHTTQQENFTKIPGHPIAYWVSERFANTFAMGMVGDHGETKKGMFTGNNDLWLRFWHEIDWMKFGCQFKPYNKGGPYKKWFGNNKYVVNWRNKGTEIKAFSGSGNINDRLYFIRCVTWSLITSGKPSFRYIDDEMHAMGDAGPTALFNSIPKAFYVLASLNSVVTEMASYVINPTINLSSGVGANLPLQYGQNQEIVVPIAEENVSLAKSDWDSFETSWDFKKHPLI